MHKLKLESFTTLHESHCFYICI